MTAVPGADRTGWNGAAGLATRPDALMSVLFQDPGTGVVLLDRDGTILHANDTVRRHFGTASLDGRAAAFLFAPNQRATITGALHAASTGEARPFASRLAGAEAEAVRVMISPWAEPNDVCDTIRGGFVLRLVAVPPPASTQVATDERHHLLGQVATGIAHDFNNVLLSISAVTEALLDRTGLDAPVSAELRRIEQVAGRGSALVRRILDFGRPAPDAACDVVLEDALGSMHAMLDRLLPERIAVSLDLAPARQVVRIDPTQLDRVLLNLAINARDAMPDGGVLVLRSTSRSLPHPLSWQNSVVAAGEYALIEVCDTGRGIAPEHLQRIFEPFFTTRAEAGGTGLGLSNVRDIVAEAGGTVTVDSVPGRGTRIRVYLPRRDPPGPVVDGSQRTLLFVEDEPNMHPLAEALLGRHGWQVVAVEDAAAALAAIGPRPPALVVSDIDLPGGDGVALALQLRRAHPGLPVILTSGYADEALRAQLAGAGIAFLDKPYSFAALAELAGQIASAPGGTVDQIEKCS